MEELTDGDKKLLADIDNVGWHVLKVLEDDKGPGFAHSVGLHKTFGHPEIIVVGLKLDLAHILINNIGYDIKPEKSLFRENFITALLTISNAL